MMGAYDASDAAVRLQPRLAGAPPAAAGASRGDGLGPQGGADLERGEESCLPSPLLVGVALPGGVCAGSHEPMLRYSTPDAVARIRKSRKELCGALQRLVARPQFREGFVWNTCQRIEFYGWLRSPDSPARRVAATALVTQELFGAARHGLEVNQLDGCQVWYHLMRTACGLNSRLPGDLDVTAQLETAVHVARCVGAAGGRAEAMLARVLRVAEAVSRSTDWGGFRAGYCRAALSQVQDPQASAWSCADHVVIGGSTTSRSIIDTLVGHYHVPQERITLVYRGHHGQWKLLRDALGGGRRLRVQAYTEPAIMEAVAAADVVFFGLDVAGPILADAAISGLRDFRRRPLLLVDFNSFGSVGACQPARGITLLTAPQLDAAVNRYADALRRRPEFCRAAEEADRWIRYQGLPQVGSAAPRLATA